MTALNLVELIEEMIEIKVRHHTAAEAKNHGPANKQLARVIFETTSVDRDRLTHVKQMLVQALEGA